MMQLSIDLDRNTREVLVFSVLQWRGLWSSVSQEQNRKWICWQVQSILEYSRWKSRSCRLAIKKDLKWPQGHEIANDSPGSCVTPRIRFVLACEEREMLCTGRVCNLGKQCSNAQLAVYKTRPQRRREPTIRAVIIPSSEDSADRVMQKTLTIYYSTYQLRVTAIGW